MKAVEDVLFLLTPGLEDRVRAEIEAAGGRPRRGALGKDWMALPADGKTVQLRLVSAIPDALSLLADHYFNYVVVDNRAPASRGKDCFADSLAQMFMERVHFSGDPERMFPSHRIIVVLEEDECLATHAFELGRLKVGAYVVHPFAGTLFDAMDRQADVDKDPGKTALCLSGGGVEGFLFELGVLRALNAHLQSRSVIDFDIFCGISAGSLLASFVANAAEPEEIAEVVEGRGVPSGDRFSPGVMYDPDLPEYLDRLLRLVRRAPFMSWNELISSLLKTVPVGFFKGEALRQFVQRQLTKDGRTDNFEELQKELYIGATDQDTSAHVVFGHGQWTDIPISTAVRASCALTPFYEPQKIRGRYFVDGQYTRTSNFHFAVERGAKLVIVINPLVPLRIDQPGYVREKGGVFCGLQALKAVINTRFMHSFRHAVTNYPEVSFVLFSPEADDMRLLSGSPMKYNLRTEILNSAYRCTVRKIQRHFEILSGTFAKHGFRLQRYPRLRSTPKEVL